MTPQQILAMKRRIVSLVLVCAAGLVFAGCASNRSNGTVEVNTHDDTVQVNIHIPKDMAGRPITIFVNGHPVKLDDVAHAILEE